MDGHNDLLGELAADAALERSDFLIQATEQLRKFLDHHKERIAVLGGLTLIDEEPDYLSIAPDLSFRSRSRYQDEITGDWVSETEVIESASELVELYNPADIYAAFTEAAKEASGLRAEPTAEGDLMDASGISIEETVVLGEDPYAAAADSWAAGQGVPLDADDDEAAAHRLYDLALEYQERSQRSESRLLEEFEGAATGLSGLVGELIIVDDDDERLTLTAGGTFRAEVIPEDADGEWRMLTNADELVEFYDPTDVFGDLADSLAEAYPSVAPELGGDGGRVGEGRGECRPRRRGRGQRGRGGRGRRRGRRRDRGQADRVSMRLAAAELVESREILPGQWLQSFHAPDIASGSRAGQFVHVRTGDFSGMVLRRPFSLNTTDASTGIVTIHYRVIGRGTEWFTRLRPGDTVDMLGPLGRPFEVDPRSQHLLLVAGGLGMAGVRMLADEAIRDGRQVTLLFGGASLREVYPSSLLPDEVEYVVATDDGSMGHHGFVTELLPDYEAWADQAFACGPAPMLAALARLAASRRERLGVANLGRKRGAGKADPIGSPAARRKAFLQVSMEQNMGCAVGACLGCVVMSVTGTPQRVCREGPVFASDELQWEGAWS